MRTMILTITVVLFPMIVFAAHSGQSEAGQHTKHYEQSLFQDDGQWAVFC